MAVCSSQHQCDGSHSALYQMLNFFTTLTIQITVTYNFRDKTIFLYFFSKSINFNEKSSKLRLILFALSSLRASRSVYISSLGDWQVNSKKKKKIICQKKMCCFRSTFSPRSLILEKCIFLP